MIVTAIILTSAQSPNHELCNEAYNAVFGNATRNPTACGAAYSALSSGNATKEQSVMVCSESHECYRMIANITNLCNNTQMNTVSNCI